MATPPFSSGFITKLKSATAWRFNSELGEVFTPRFFCCDDPNSLGITAGKAPVAVLELSPNPALVGENVTFDGRDSYDPDGSITDYDFTFPSGTPATSILSNGTVTWAAGGEYQVELIVEDGTGLKSNPARTIITILEPTGKFYMATDNGVEYTDDGGQSWTSKNTGLAGDALTVNHLTIDPVSKYYTESSKILWIATDDGLYVSIDGAANWVKNSPSTISNIYSDTPAPAIGDLIFVKVLVVGNFVFALANWTNAGGDERAVLFQGGDLSEVREDTSVTLTWVEITDGYTL